MNFLAHQYLSFEIENVMVGNFIADTVKGKEFETYTEQIKLGIIIHRSIDSFTDRHEVVKETRKLLQPYFGKYAVVVQDIYYDHFLAVNWEEYHHMDLESFVQYVYKVLYASSGMMNDRSKRTLQFMKTQNWLFNYRTFDGIGSSLNGLAARTTFPNNMTNGIPPLREHFREMEGHFKSFFPELEWHIRQAYRDEINAQPRY